MVHGRTPTKSKAGTGARHSGSGVCAACCSHACTSVSEKSASVQPLALHLTSDRCVTGGGRGHCHRVDFSSDRRCLREKPAFYYLGNILMK